METIVPLISSRCLGPLGVAHLPRLWLKLLLHALGRLPDGYRHGVGGFDEMTCNALGIPAEDLIAYVTSVKPHYLQFEEWVRARADLNHDRIAMHNADVLARDKTVENAAEQRAYIGEGAPETRNAVLLNELDDWVTLHRALLAVASPAP